MTVTTLEEAHKDLVHQWKAFNVDIRDIYSDFDQLYWIRTLSVASLRYILYLTKLINLVNFTRRNHGHFIQFIPVLALSLVCGVVLAYFFVLHEVVIKPRWCDGGRFSSEDQPCTCLWSNVILTLACYIGFMIVYYYVITVFTSPGVVKTIEHGPSASSGTGASSDTCTSTDSKSKAKDEQYWKSYNGQGGSCYIHVRLNPSYERELVELHERQKNGGTSRNNDDGKEALVPDSGSVFIPSPSSSYCKKCETIRPPRSHHCSQCNRCVLQMDHHCIWMNNCIGYNNYRTFVWTLIYLVIGCWYGVAILFMPFYETIENQIELKGWRILYENKSGFLDLPMPLDILRELWDTGALDVGIVLKLVVPLLIGAGIFLTSFLCSHLSYIRSGLTTLERMAVLTFQGQQALDKLCEERKAKMGHMKIINPYDQGGYKNLLQVMGPTFCLGFLPFIRNKPPIPCIAKKTKSD